MAATAHPTEPAFDREKAQRFADRMVGALNQSAVVLMTSIGHRSGLFDVMARHDRLTSAELAKAAALDERYVRRWLGAMVTGAVVEYHVADRTYRLPPEHAAALTRAAVPTTSPPPRSGCRCWPASRTRSSPASAPAAASRTAPTRAFTK
jgi:hypothetical protein